MHLPRFSADLAIGPPSRTYRATPRPQSSPRRSTIVPGLVWNAGGLIDQVSTHGLSSDEIGDDEGAVAEVGVEELDIHEVEVNDAPVEEVTAEDDIGEDDMMAESTFEAFPVDDVEIHEGAGSIA